MCQTADVVSTHNTVVRAARTWGTLTLATYMPQPGFHLLAGVCVCTGEKVWPGHGTVVQTLSQVIYATGETLSWPMKPMNLCPEQSIIIVIKVWAMFSCDLINSWFGMSSICVMTYCTCRRNPRLSLHSLPVGLRDSGGQGRGDICSVRQPYWSVQNIIILCWVMW